MVIDLGNNWRVFKDRNGSHTDYGINMYGVGKWDTKLYQGFFAGNSKGTSLTTTIIYYGDWNFGQPQGQDLNDNCREYLAEIIRRYDEYATSHSLPNYPDIARPDMMYFCGIVADVLDEPNREILKGISSSLRPVKSDLNVEDEAAYWDGLEDAACGLAPADEDDPSYMKGYRNGKRRSGQKNYADKIYNDELASSHKPIKSSREVFEMNSYITGRNHVSDLPFSCTVIKTDDGFEWRDIDIGDNYVNDRGEIDEDSPLYGQYDTVDEFISDIEDFLNSWQGPEEMQRAYENRDSSWFEDNIVSACGKKKGKKKPVKSARFLAEDDDGQILAEADTYEEAESVAGCTKVIDTESQDMEGQEDMGGLFQSRKITSAVDGGWEVRSSDVPKALDLFVEYFGEEDALEQIAKAMSDDTLEENIDWIAQQWGFAEDIEELDDAWDKYETAKEIMGESELFNNLTQAAGYDELAEDLAFIFRMNDFREWDEVSGYDDDEDDEDDEDDDEDEEDDDFEEDNGITNSHLFPIKTVKNILSGRWSEDYAAECIAQKQDINVGYAKQLLSSWIEQYKPKLIKSGILDIAEDINTEFDIDGDLESWFEQYCNREGKSNTVGGEMVRAANQIIYRYNNDGDMIGRGYGNETVNAAARYITEKAEMGVNEQIQAWLDHNERADETDYDSFIETFTTEIEQILRENPELFQKPNKDDYWDWKIDDDMNYGLDECYLDDGLGNQYWFQLDSGDRWYCTGIELDPYHTAYSEGDYISEGDDYVDEIDRTEEFGSFEADGFIYEYAGDEMDDDTGEYTSWQITKVTSTDPFCDEGDTFDFYDLEPDELAGFRLFDHNGNEIDERTFLASSLIKSNITSGEEVVIEIERHGKWEIVAQSDDERGWTLKGDAVPAIFDNKAEAKSSQLAKDLERDGYSPNQGNMRFKKYS